MDKTFVGNPCIVCGSTERYISSGKCAPCKRAHSSARYAEKRPEIRAKQKEYQELTGYSTKYYAENKEYFKAYARERYFQGKKQGLTREGFDAALVAQSGRCAICLKPLVTIRVDHDHKTGKFRGLLCFNHNVGLGHFQDSVETLQRAIEYLQST